MTRYAFNIRTRTGQRINHICIMAASREDAERRLRQMYRQCEIVDCDSEDIRRNDTLDIEGVISLISNNPATVPAVARSMLRHKAGGD